MRARTLALAIDLGGTKVDAALVDADGAVLAETVHRAPTGRDASRDEVTRPSVAWRRRPWQGLIRMTGSSASGSARRGRSTCAAAPSRR